MSSIYYFNPGHEGAVLNNTPSYTPPASMRRMAQELGALAAWYATHDAVVFVDENYDMAYHKNLQDKGLLLPSLITEENLRQYADAEINVWGMSPIEIRMFSHFNKEFDINLKLPEWDDRYIYLNSRMASRDVLVSLKKDTNSFDNIKEPMFCADIKSITAVVEAKLTRMLAKSPYSSSGRGLLWIPPSKVTRVEEQILQGMLKRQGQVTLEPVYEKIIDFAMEFLCDGQGNISFVGYSLFWTNDRGAYLGNSLESQISIVDKLLSYIDGNILEEAKQKLLKNIINIYGTSYRGCIGVDMMIFKEAEKYYLHPCVEVNMRYNMGYLSLMLADNFLSDHALGKYMLDFNSSGLIYTDHQQKEKDFPLIISNGRIVSGYLSLCSVNENTHFRAYIIVEKL